MASDCFRSDKGSTTIRLAAGAGWNKPIATTQIKRKLKSNSGHHNEQTQNKGGLHYKKWSDWSHVKVELTNQTQTMELDIHRLNRWLSARLQYLQCISNGDTAVLHQAIDIYISLGCKRLNLLHSQIVWDERCHHIFINDRDKLIKCWLFYHWLFFNSNDINHLCFSLTHCNLGLWLWFQRCNFQMHCSDYLHERLHWNCIFVNGKGPYRWQVNNHSGSGLLLPGNKPMTEPMLTKIHDTIWHQ